MVVPKKITYFAATKPNTTEIMKKKVLQRMEAEGAVLALVFEKNDVLSYVSMTDKCVKSYRDSRKPKTFVTLHHAICWHLCNGWKVLTDKW